MMFICQFKGVESATTASKKHQDRRKNARLKLLMNILSCDVHSSLVDGFYCIIAQQTFLHNHTTRLAFLSAPVAISAKSSFYHFSFLPRTLRGLKSYFKQLPFLAGKVFRLIFRLDLDLAHWIAKVYG